LVEANDEFLDAKRKKGLRPQTLEKYEGMLRRFRKSLPTGAMLQDVVPADVRAFVFDASLANATQRSRFRHVRAFFNWAVKQDYIEDSPVDDVDPPKKEKAFLRPPEVQDLLETIEEHIMEVRDVAGRIPDLEWLHQMIPVAVCTGLRRGELVALQWADVDLTRRSIHVRHRGDFRTKGNAERRVPIRGDAEEVLGRMHEPGITGPVFVDRNGDPIRPDRVSKRFKAMARKAGLDERIHFHSLRHTTGSWLSMRGVPLRHIQAILGHSTTSVTEMYSHLAPETLDRAMEETFGES
jgi:site-specific recombinase XerD